MQVVIIAAGEGTRMRPLTLTTPKPLAKILDKTLLDYIFLSLPDEITEAIIVVKYLGEKIKAFCGDNFHGRTIQYAEGSPLGSAYSFLAAQPLVHDERFLFINADEFPAKEDVVNCLSYPQSILCFEVDDPWNHGVPTLRPDGTIAEIREKPADPVGNLISNGIMVLTKDIFTYPPEQKSGGEYYFTSMVNKYVKDHAVQAVRSAQGIGGVSTMEDLKRVEEFLKQKI